MASLRTTSLLFLILLLLPSPASGQESLDDFLSRILEDGEVNDDDIRQIDAVPSRDKVNPDAVHQKDEEKKTTTDDDALFWTSDKIGLTCTGSIGGLAFAVWIIRLILQIRNDAAILFDALRRVADLAAYVMALCGRVRRRPQIIALPSP